MAEREDVTGAMGFLLKATPPPGTHVWIENGGYGYAVCASSRDRGQRWKTARVLVLGVDDAHFADAEREALSMLAEPASPMTPR